MNNRYRRRQVLQGVATRHARQSATVLIICAWQLTAIWASATEMICVEAESATAVSEPMMATDATVTQQAGAAVPAPGASGSSYLEVPQGKGNPPAVTGGVATVTFETNQDGQYYLWCRAWWTDECANSASLSVDGAPPFTFGQDATYKHWHWVKAPLRLKQLKLSAGRHVLKISNREDGIRLDQILVTNDKKYVPVGIEAIQPIAGQ